MRRQTHRRTREKTISRPLEIYVTEAAETDLAEIWAYLAAEASPDIATVFVESITKAFEPLRHHPHAGASREAFFPGLRVTFHRRYAIYYHALPNRLVIIRVLHGARDAAAIAEHGGFSADWRP